MTSSYESFLGQSEAELDFQVNRFGNREALLESNAEEGFSKKLIHLDTSPNLYAVDYKQQAKHLQDLTAILKGEKEFAEIDENKPYTCHSQRTPEPDSQFALAPVWTGMLKPKTNDKISYEGNCFE
jgi:hypothetical protein